MEAGLRRQMWRKNGRVGVLKSLAKFLEKA